MSPDRDLIVAAWPRDLATIAFRGPSGGRLRLFDIRIQASITATASPRHA